MKPTIVLVKQQHGSSFADGLILTIGGIGGILSSLIASPMQKRFRFGPIIISTIWINAYKGDPDVS